jgi:hypothetical protein
MIVRNTYMHPKDYLDTLRMDGPEWVQVDESDGASLYKLTDEHFVVIQCLAHTGHRGWEVYARSLPKAFVEFAGFVNPDLRFRARHYGPPLGETAPCTHPTPDVP